MNTSENHWTYEEITKQAEILISLYKRISKNGQTDNSDLAKTQDTMAWGVFWMWEQLAGSKYPIGNYTDDYRRFLKLLEGENISQAGEKQ